MTLYQAQAEELRRNARQWQAYEANGTAIILAGPGSGKTKVLTIKLTRMLNEDVHPPRGIACVTYSGECARELRRRLERLGVVESSRLFVGTLHSFCLQHILMPYARLLDAAVPEVVRVAGLNQQKKIFDAARAELGMGASSDLRRMVDTFRRDNLEIDEWDLSEDVARLAAQYEISLKDAGCTDFDGIVRDAVLLLEEHETIRRCLKAKFPILLVDEYQDLGLALHRMVMKLCFDSGVRLVAVGDPDQSIYAFNGAHPEHLVALAKRADVTTVRFGLNYRSGAKIVRAAKATMKTTVAYEADRTSESIVAYPGCKGGIDGQAKYLVEVLLPDVLTRWKPGDVLISFRTKYEADAVETALQGAHHQYVKIGSNSAYPKAPLTRFVEECAKWSAGGWETGDPRLSRLGRTWIALQRLTDQDEQRRERLKLVRFLFAHRTPDAAANAWLNAFEADLLLVDDSRTRLLAGGDVECFDDLRDAVQPGHALEQFTVRNLGGQVGSPDHLNLVTLHSSKGTEFPVVVLVGADEGSFPWASVARGSKAEAEDRRLFYVGISRAKDELYILWSPAVEGDRRRQGASRFLREMHQRLKEEAAAS